MTMTEQRHGPAVLAGAEWSCLPEALLARAAATPGAVACRRKRLGRWHEYTWAAHAQEVAQLAAGMRGLGIEPGDHVAIVAGNRPEWLFIDLAAQGLGAVTVGLDPAAPATELAQLLGGCHARSVFVDGDGTLAKVIAARRDGASLRHIIELDPDDNGGRMDTTVRSYDDVRQLGSSCSDHVRAYADAVAEIDGDQVALLQYTSGVTATPRGVPVTHAILRAAALAAADAIGLDGRDEMFSQIPLCHPVERVLSVAGGISAGCVVNFGEAAMSVRTDTREVQPTVMIASAAFWRDLHADVACRLRPAADSALRRRTAVGRMLAAPRLRHLLGLRRLRTAIGVGGPVASDAADWFASLGVPVRSAYGLAETVGLVALGAPGGAGPLYPMPGVDIRAGAEGQILIRGPMVARSTVDDSGWLATADVGVFAGSGFELVGRQTGPGQPSPSVRRRVEDRLRRCPYLDEALVVGGSADRLVVLVELDYDAVVAWAADHDLDLSSRRQLVRAQPVIDLVAAAVAAVNDQLDASAQVASFRLLPRALAREDGTLSSIQEPRRQRIAAVYADLIAEALGEAGLSNEEDR